MLVAKWKHTYSGFACFSKQLKLSQPNVDELGYADSVSVEEIGGARVCFAPLCAFAEDKVPFTPFLQHSLFYR